MTRAEMAIFRRRRSEDSTAWSHYREAVGVIALGGWNEETLAEAISQLRNAIAQDANFALPRALLALLTGMRSRFSLVPGVTGERDVLEQANRAIEIDPHDSEVLGYAGCALADIGDLKRGSAILQRAVELDPSNAQTLVALGARTDTTRAVLSWNRESQVGYPPQSAGLPPELLGYALG